MNNNTKVLIALALAGLSFFACTACQKEYRRIQERIELTQVRLDAVADELREAIADIRKVIKSMQQWLTKIAMAREAELQPEKQSEPKPIEKPIEKPIQPTIIMHSGYSCGPCNAWISTEKGKWEKAGWTIDIVKEIDSVRSWPWYEITDRDGKRFEVIGPLNSNNFQAAKLGK